MTTQQAQRIYLKGARLITKNDEKLFSCIIIKELSPDGRLERAYRRAMQSDRQIKDLILITDVERDEEDNGKSFRVLLLTMMATVYPDLKKQGVFDEPQR